MKRIDSIAITNIRGLSYKKFQVQIFANHPNILVAPNGYGKTSICKAFSGLRTKDLKIDKDDLFEKKESNLPMIEIEVCRDDNTNLNLIADTSSNSISQEFDVYTICGGLIPKARVLKIPGTAPIAVPSLHVPEIVILSKYDKQNIAYQYSANKTKFGNNGKAIFNLSGRIHDHSLFIALDENVDFNKFDQIKESRAIIDLTEEFNKYTGASHTIHAAFIKDIEPSKISPALNTFIEVLLKYNCGGNRSEAFTAVIQILWIWKCDKALFNKHIKNLGYESKKKEISDLFSTIRKTWKSISPVETDKGFVLKFPEAYDISNGERDVLRFYAELLKLKFRSSKKPTIIIIDELFDYLDDANLVAAQYFISQSILDYQKNGITLFPIILTHLNPQYFKNFVFTKQKVSFLNRQLTQVDQTTKRIVDFRNENERTNKNLYNDMSKYFFHYYPNEYDFSSVFATNSFISIVTKTSEFITHVNSELAKYKSGVNAYDPLSVCCAIRIEIEKRIYDQLPSPESKEAFVNKHATPKKLDFAEDEYGVDVPSCYRLLGVVYNDALHARFSNDLSSPIYSKLNNETIFHMIKTL